MFDTAGMGTLGLNSWTAFWNTQVPNRNSFTFPPGMFSVGSRLGLTVTVSFGGGAGSGGVIRFAGATLMLQN